MVISQSEKKLNAAFETARQLKETIETHYSSKSSTIYLKKLEIQKKIVVFITSNQEIINQCIENKNTASDILLAKIMKEFRAINKLLDTLNQFIVSKQQTGNFFFDTQQNRQITPLKQLKIHLKTIDEVFNMLAQKTPATVIHSTRTRQRF